MIAAATRIDELASADPGQRLTPELAQKVSEDLAQMRAASDRFGPLVAEATGFIRSTALLLTFLPLGGLVAFLLLVRAATLHTLLEAAGKGVAVLTAELVGITAEELKDAKKGWQEERKIGRAQDRALAASHVAQTHPR